MMTTNKGNKTGPDYLGAQRIIATYSRLCRVKYGYWFVLCLYTTPIDNY